MEENHYNGRTTSDVIFTATHLARVYVCIPVLHVRSLNDRLLCVLCV
jgi:hypothetical protein